MSLVTTVVIFGSSIPRETQTALCDGTFKYGERDVQFQPLADLDHDYFGGQKYPEADVFGAALNHLDRTLFFEWLRGLDWGYGGAVVVWECNGESQGVEKVGDYREVLP